jgi:hypothetical protein
MLWALFQYFENKHKSIKETKDNSTALELHTLMCYTTITRPHCLLYCQKLGNVYVYVFIPHLPQNYMKVPPPIRVGVY